LSILESGDIRNCKDEVVFGEAPSDTSIDRKEVVCNTVVVDFSLPPQCVTGAHRTMRVISKAQKL
jgi:hypothetical protein